MSMMTSRKKGWTNRKKTKLNKSEIAAITASAVAAVSATAMAILAVASTQFSSGLRIISLMFAVSIIACSILNMSRLRSMIQNAHDSEKIMCYRIRPNENIMSVKDHAGNSLACTDPTSKDGISDKDDIVIKGYKQA